MQLRFAVAARSRRIWVATVALMFPALAFPQSNERILRLGLIGLDTSHVIAFTELLNDPSNPQHVPGAKVVAAFKGGSPDNELSRKVIDGFSAELRDKWKVEIVPDIPTLCQRVDAVLLESVDGRPHLEQLKPVLAAKKPVFIDKPLAANFKDAREIVRLAKVSGVPWFSSSGLRFWDETVRLKNAPAGGKILGAETYGPATLEVHHMDMAWYGIHAIEMLYALMGPGCKSVTRSSTDGADVIVGLWKDGRIGSVRGIRKGAANFGFTLFREKAIVNSAPVAYSYRPLAVEIVRFLQTGVAPVNPDETLEIFAFMEAADRSKARGGVPVSLSEILK